MAYEVEVTDEWLRWYESLGVEEQDGLAASIGLLEAKGPHLPFPYSSGVASSRHSHMCELRWYDVHVPRADDLYDEHLRILEEEGLT
jgi:hypothetical protein